MKRHGFSLVEILVATVILVALAALLFPALSSVTQRAAGNICQGNLRSIGAALFSYMGDHNGEYPPNRANYVWSWAHGTNGAPDVYQILQQEGYLSHNGGPPERWSWDPTKWPGLPRKNAGVWYCPADTQRPLVYSDSCYGQNENLGMDDRNYLATVPGYVPSWRPWKNKPAADARSGSLIYLVDHDHNITPKSTCGNFFSASWPLRGGDEATGLPSGQYGVAFRHSGKTANALFVDGSVRILRFSDLVNTWSKYLAIPD